MHNWPVISACLFSYFLRVINLRALLIIIVIFFDYCLLTWVHVNATAYDDQYQSWYLGEHEHVLNFGGGLDVPAVDESYETYIWTHRPTMILIHWFNKFERSVSVHSTTVVLTNHGSRQQSDRLLRVVAFREERLNDVVGESQSHDGVGCRPAQCKQIYVRRREG